MTLPPTRTRPGRAYYLRLIVADPREGPSRYNVSCLTEAAGRPVWRFHKLRDDDEVAETYDVSVDDYGVIGCTCWGATAHGRCKHVDFIRAAARAYEPALKAKIAGKPTPSGRCGRCGGLRVVVTTDGQTTVAPCPECANS